MSKKLAIQLPLRHPAGKSAAPARFLDLIVAATGLALFSPIMLLAAVAIWIEGGRPIVFSQRRIGQFGRPFYIHKFRKFAPTANADGPLSTKDDPRLTRVGEQKPGIFGPAQVMFRDEASFYPHGADSDQFYRQVLFPIKASLDLAYYPRRTIVSDIKWIFLGTLAVMDMRPSQASVVELIELKEAAQ
jgi:lipopolysaccharide/colanic/teichoic acid biosynthesis glycosyltransferase